MLDERLKTAYTYLLLILALSAVLRFSLLDQESLWNDELYSVGIANLGSAGAIVEAEIADGHPPSYFLLLREWKHLVGDSETAIRSLSAVFGTFIPLLVFGLGRALSLPAAACLLGSLLYSLNTQAVWYSQEVRMYSLLSFLGTLHLMLTIRLLRQPRGEPGKVTTALWWLSGALVIWSHFFGVFFLATGAVATGLMIGLLLKKRATSSSPMTQRKRRRARRLAVRFAYASAGWFLVALPLISMMARRVSGQGVSWIEPMTWETPWQVLEGLIIGEQLETGPPLLRLATVSIFLIVLAIPIARLRRGSPRSALFGVPLLFALFLLGTLFAISLFRPIIHGGSRYVSIAGAPLCLAGAVGIYLLMRGRWYGRGFAALALSLVLASDAAYLSIYYRGREKRMWREAIEYISAKALRVPIVTLPEDTSDVLGYYVRGRQPLIRLGELVRTPGEHRQAWLIATGLNGETVQELARNGWVIRTTVVIGQSWESTELAVCLLERMTLSKAG